MTVYQSFVKLYDLLVNGAPYGTQCEQTVRLLASLGITDEIAAELGRGTGNCTERSTARDFDMVGTDSAEEMLEEVLQKKVVDGGNMFYLCQDMRESKLYSAYHVITSRYDATNYLCGTGEPSEVSRLISSYPGPSDIFLFNMNTIYKYEQLLADNTFAENREKDGFIQENHYNSETTGSIYDTIFYLREEGGYYHRAEETHVQRAYTLAEVKEAAERASMVLIAAMDVKTERALADESKRVLILLREQGKEVNNE